MLMFPPDSFTLYSLFQNASTVPFAEQAEVTMKTNFLGTLNVWNTLFPILRPHARYEKEWPLMGVLMHVKVRYFLFVYGISLTSGQLSIELFQDCLKVMLFALCFTPQG